MVEEDGGRGAGAEEGAVEGRWDGDVGDAAGDVRPCVDEMESSEAVGGRVVDCSAEADATALEERYLCRSSEIQVSSRPGRTKD